MEDLRKRGRGRGDVPSDREISEEIEKETVGTRERDGSHKIDFQGQEGGLSLESWARGSGSGLERLASSKRS